MAYTGKRPKDMNKPTSDGSGQRLNTSNRKYGESTKVSTKKNAAELETLRGRISKRASKKA